MNDRDVPFYNRTNPTTENIQEAFLAMLAKQEISDFFKKKFKINDDRYFDQIYFFRPIFDEIRSDNTGLPSLSSTDANIRQTIKQALFKDVASEILEKIPDINSRAPTDDDKNIIRDIYKNFVLRINNVISRGNWKLETTEQNVLISSAVDFAADRFWQKYICFIL
jgi:hypothetical protein